MSAAAMPTDPELTLALKVLPMLDDDLVVDLVELFALAIVDHVEARRAERALLAVALRALKTKTAELHYLQRRYDALLGEFRTARPADDEAA